VLLADAVVGREHHLAHPLDDRLHRVVVALEPVIDVGIAGAHRSS